MIDFKSPENIPRQFINKQGVIFIYYSRKREMIELYRPGHFLLRYLHGGVNRFAVARMTRLSPQPEDESHPRWVRFSVIAKKPDSVSHRASGLSGRSEEKLPFIPSLDVPSGQRASRQRFH